MGRVVVSIIALIILGTIVVGRVEAQTTDIDTEVPDAEYNFGQQITFHLKATAPTTITKANLFLSVEGQSDTTAVPVPIDPGSEIAVDFQYNTAGHELPPFAVINYWWQVHDQSGAQHSTEKKLLYYSDNRFGWQSVAGKPQGISLEVYWVQGDVVFGQSALNVAVQALNKIYQQLQEPVPGVIRIFIYPSEGELRNTLNLTGYEWAGGQARPDLGVILIGIPDGPGALGEMERLIPHELTHLLVYQATRRIPDHVPPWLNEGLATLNEFRPDANRQALLEQALAEDGLFPLQVLCAPFPTDENAARLAYAQSESLVSYLQEEYGRPVVRELLAAYVDDPRCEAGVAQVLDKDLEGLDATWRAYLASQVQSTGSKGESPWLALWLLTALLALPLLGVLRSKRK